MTDDQIEDVLRRYQLSGPVEGLESRILTAADRPRSVTLGVADYRLLLAAAVLILAVILSDPDTPSVPRHVDASWRAEVAAAAAVIGGDERALELAEVMVPAPQKSESEEETW